jgi:hypothetical protein
VLTANSSGGKAGKRRRGSDGARVRAPPMSPLVLKKVFHHKILILLKIPAFLPDSSIRRAALTIVSKWLTPFRVQMLKWFVNYIHAYEIQMATRPNLA